MKVFEMKVLAFAASNSRNSINKTLVSYAKGLLEAGLLDNTDVEVIDINDYEMSLYSVERERDEGIPDQAQQFYRKIGEADALIISLAEHNGFYTAAYKNLFDWTSRVDKNVYQNKPAVLFSTSPGPRGAGNVLKVAKESAPFFGMDLRADVSIPRFYENFDVKHNRISNAEIQEQLESALASLN
jgi:NAD(P)H-dependent FMN reductase